MDFGGKKGPRPLLSTARWKEGPPGALFETLSSICFFPILSKVFPLLSKSLKIHQKRLRETVALSLGIDAARDATNQRSETKHATPFDML